MMYTLRETALRAPYPLRSLIINGFGFARMRRRFGGDFRRISEHFARTEELTPAEVEELQLARLGTILQVAAQTPYYRRFDLGADLGAPGASPFDVLRRLPSLSKDVLREEREAMRNPHYRGKAMLHGSSGTTGEKVRFYMPRVLHYKVNAANSYRFRRWFGVERFDRRVTLGGRVFTRRPPYWAYNAAENQLLLSTHHLGTRTVPAYLEKIRRFQPGFMQGHPSGFQYLAKYVRPSHRPQGLKAIFTTGEVLTEDARAEIEAAFGCPVAQTYGSGEAVIAAAECEYRQGYHEASEYGLIELRDTGLEGVKEVHGTSLWNTAMPMLRYQLGDMAIPAEDRSCRCGRPLPLKIKTVVGRTGDMTRTAEGEVVLPVTVRMAIKPLLAEHQSYQVVQTGRGDYLVRLTPTDEEAGDTNGQIVRRALRAIYGEKARIGVEFTGELRTPGGKLRTVVDATETRV